MFDKIREAADTCIKFVRSDVNERQESIKVYHQIRDERKRMISQVRMEIQTRIEKACRTGNSIEISDLGFERISFHLYEDSWQEKVVKMLEDDGYKCIMNFNYIDARPHTYLKVKW